MTKKRLLRDDSAADREAKRMKHVLNISSNENRYNSDEDKKEAPGFGPWESYMTSSNSATRDIAIILRFPDDQRHCLNLNDACQLRVIFAFIHNLGLNTTNCTLRLLYPDRVFDLRNASSTLGEIGLFSQELIHVNQRVD